MTAWCEVCVIHTHTIHILVLIYAQNPDSGLLFLFFVYLLVLLYGFNLITI